MDNDSDMLLGDFVKAKSIGNVADGEGHFLRNRNQATFEEDQEEEFTENLSSDTTAETPNKNIQIREPVLEFGAVDKPFKEFGPALEFEGLVTSVTLHQGIHEPEPVRPRTQLSGPVRGQVVTTPYGTVRTSTVTFQRNSK